MANYQCPTCSGVHERSDFKKNICPSCGQPVKFIRKRVNNRFSYQCVPSNLKEEEAPVQAGPQEEIEDMATGEGVLLSNKDDIPEVWLTEEPEDKPPKYKVIYRGMAFTGWLYCPHCETRMFKNIFLHNPSHADEHMCKACKALVTFVFVAAAVFRTRI